MNKQAAHQLRRQADEFAALFSRSDRPKNHNNETFKVVRIRPLTDSSAAVVMRKNTGKLAVAWFYWVARANNPEWRGFFVKHEHLASLDKVREILHEVEHYNWDKNFDDERADKGEAQPPGQ